MLVFSAMEKLRVKCKELFSVRKNVFPAEFRFRNYFVFVIVTLIVDIFVLYSKRHFIQLL